MKQKLYLWADKSGPTQKRAQKAKNQKVRKQKNLTKGKLSVYMRKSQKYFSNLKATKIGLQKYHKIKKQDTKIVTK